MPRKTKEQSELKDEKKVSKKVSSATKKNTTSKKNTSRKTTTSKKSASKKTTTSKKSASKKTTVSKKSTTKKVDVLEYYDLPYRYNQTTVKVLAQTPTTLFIYWDISDKDRENYQKQYGDNFFEVTKPVLIVYNDTLRI